MHTIHRHCFGDIADSSWFSSKVHLRCFFLITENLEITEVLLSVATVHRAKLLSTCCVPGTVLGTLGYVNEQSRVDNDSPFLELT